VLPTDNVIREILTTHCVTKNAHLLVHAQVCFTFSTPLYPPWIPVLQLVEREIRPLHCRWPY